VVESNIGTGGACGSIFLDDGFERLLRQKLGRTAETILTERTLMGTMLHFENTIKRNFNPYNPSCDDEYEVPICGAPDQEDIGLLSGYLTLSRQTILMLGLLTQFRREIESVFTAIFVKIFDLVNNQIRGVENKFHKKLKVLL
jgi:hypothetical protein